MLRKEKLKDKTNTKGKEKGTLKALKAAKEKVILQEIEKCQINITILYMLSPYYEYNELRNYKIITLEIYYSNMRNQKRNY